MRGAKYRDGGREREREIHRESDRPEDAPDGKKLVTLKYRETSLIKNAHPPRVTIGP